MKTSACCSTDSLTIFQKQSETARLRFFVVTWWAFSMPSLVVRVSLQVSAFKTHVGQVDAGTHRSSLEFWKKSSS